MVMKGPPKHVSKMTPGKSFYAQPGRDSTSHTTLLDNRFVSLHIQATESCSHSISKSRKQSSHEGDVRQPTLPTETVGMSA